MSSVSPTRVHGSLVQVADVGVLIQGDSGVGKSECALELVMRGHSLIADDVVELDVIEGALRGAAPELVRHYLELRGIGIVHVPSLFGEDAVRDTALIDVVVHLERWERAEVERTGLDRMTEMLLEVEVACVRLPVAPGRNVASLVEVAARNHLLRERGESGVERLAAQVLRALSRDSQ